MSAADLVGATGATLLAAGGVGLCVAAAAAAKRGLIRPKVRCWFCHSDQRVPFAARNGWDCGGCGQYNGFSSDGDYNVDDPARRRRWADGEAPRYARPGAPAEGTSGAGDNGLCHTCNLNQSLKVHQLAKFVPENEANYDREVEAFQDKLEKTYRLCRNCEAIVHQSLGEQNSWLKPSLLSWRLENSRKRREKEETGGSSSPRGRTRPSAPRSRWCVAPFSSSSPSGSHPRLRALTAVTSAVLCSVVFAAKSGDLSASDAAFLQWSLSIVVLLTWLMSWIRRPRTVRPTNLLVVLSFLAVSSASSSPPPWSEWSRSLSALCMAVSTINLLRKTRPVARKQPRKTADKKSSWQYRESLSNMTARPSLPDGERRSVPVIPEEAAEHNEVPSDNASVASKASQTSSDLLYEGSCDISTLSIEENEEEEQRRRGVALPLPGKSPAFAIRAYDVGNPDDINFGCFRRPSMLKPARFNPASSSSISRSPSKKVVKASWVAGGYWQRSSPADADSESTSRASSQSSGFISQSGEPPIGSHHQLILPPPPPPRSPAASLDVGSDRAGAAFDAFDRASLASERLAGSPFLSRPSSSLSRQEGSLLGAAPPTVGKPQAESSPAGTGVADIRKASFLDHQVNIKFSLSSFLLGVSFVLNFCFCGYLFWKSL